MSTQMAPSPQQNQSKGNSAHQIAAESQPTVVASTVSRVVHQSVEPLTNEQRRELIAVTAYYLAERRDFQPGHEHEDWLEAEAQIGSLDAPVF
jgi:hypothetical protein